MAVRDCDLNAAIRAYCNGSVLMNEKLQIFNDILSITNYRLPIESTMFRKSTNGIKVSSPLTSLYALIHCIHLPFHDF